MTNLNEIIKEQLSEFESIQKGGVGSGRHKMSSNAYKLIHLDSGKVVSEGSKDFIQSEHKKLPKGTHFIGRGMTTPHSTVGTNWNVDAVTHMKKLLNPISKGFTEILKGGKGSGRKSNFHHQGKSNSEHFDEVKHIKAKSNEELDKLINDHKDSHGEAMKIYISKLRVERASRIGVKKLEEVIKEQLSEFESIFKGTAGKHWKWHGNTGSQIAISHLEGVANGFPARRTTHSENSSHFGKRPSSWKDVDNSVKNLHSHLTGNGFKVASNTVEDSGIRTSQHITYDHPDGTKIHSISNQPRDSQTELAHDVAVFHAPLSTKFPETAPVEAQGINHPTDHAAVANTILAQYGGNKFRAMTGAHSFMAGKEGGGSLTMKIPKTNGATKGIKYVKTIHDTATDTYHVHMMGRNGDVKHSESGLHADQLQSHFTHHTGLDTHI